MLRLIEKSVCDANNENKLLWLISVCVSRTGWADVCTWCRLSIFPLLQNITEVSIIHDLGDHLLWFLQEITNQMSKTISLYHCDLLSRFPLYGITSLGNFMRKQVASLLGCLCTRQDKGSAPDLTLSSTSLHTDFIFLHLKMFLAQFGSWHNASFFSLLKIKCNLNLLFVKTNRLRANTHALCQS